MGPFVSRSDNGFHVSVQEKRKFNKTRRIVVLLNGIERDQVICSI
ncbi:hypothetical protein CEV33_1417 [Brucella grignonensis]|uniref:Uncharacterized protein n=1 Tax=Brucella grignonensis TaxID=94627 RepID=A0A256FAJ9_9HYPH|nr:hypothetical protein CEV33_1417 [Brucella grignonensis]